MLPSAKNNNRIERKKGGEKKELEMEEQKREEVEKVAS